jgi:hypothetical protein
MLPLEVVGPGGSLSTALIGAPNGRDASGAWQAATEGGGAWHGGEEISRNFRGTVATGRLRHSSIGWGTAGGRSGGADRFHWQRTLNLCLDR